MRELDETVGLKNVAVWHCNDAKAACGSKLDRHQHIGEGTIGIKTFQRLLNDPRTVHAAFLAETPIDAPLDDLRNVNALKACVDPKSVLKMPAGRTAGVKAKSPAKKPARKAPASKSSRS
jgi:deoxyribonuclease-4